MKWRLIDDFPEKTGRYVVAHRGKIASDAYFTAKEGDTHYPFGWSQMPQFGPTHWLDDDTEMEGDIPNIIRFIQWPDMSKDYLDGYYEGRNRLRREIINLLKKMKFRKIKSILMYKDKNGLREYKHGPEARGLQPLDDKWRK